RGRDHPRRPLRSRPPHPAQVGAVRRTAWSTVWHGHLLRVPGRGRRPTQRARVYDARARGNARRDQTWYIRGRQPGARLDVMVTPGEFDVVIVGGGPAGLTACLAARAAGARVALVEERATLGGQIFKQPPRGFTVLRPRAMGKAFSAAAPLIAAAR